MKKVLIIEDEEKIRRVVKNYLEKNGYEVYEADNGISGLKIFRQNKFDVVILDIMLPEMDGWSVCREIRGESTVPVLMLTARSAEEDEIFGLELGADDYLKKPFSLAVLLARIKVLINRKNPISNSLQFGDLEINEGAHRVFYAKEELALAPKEYELLLYLAKNRGIALSREQILNKVWEYSYYGELRTVDTHIKKLRKKLQGKFIETVRGFGYRFEG